MNKQHKTFENSSFYLVPPRFNQLTRRLHPSGPAKATDSPNNYQIFESTAEYITRHIILELITNDPGFLHTDNEEGDEARVREEGRPPPRKVLLPRHDIYVRTLRALFERESTDLPDCLFRDAACGCPGRYCIARLFSYTSVTAGPVMAGTCPY
jgi:hypothetical protein